MACNWPWPGPSGPARPDPPPPPPPSPLLLVPGVCGSILAVRQAGEEGDGERCWVTLRDADATYQKLWGKYSKASGRLELLTPGHEVCVPQGSDDSGLYPISVLDPDASFAVKQVPYYEPFITHLQGQGYVAGQSLFGCGYDFRQSNRLSARCLLERLRAVSARCGGRRVDVVTHSMGGLVVRSLLADCPGEFEALVNKWVAIGCPFGGAPGYTVDALITGVQFAGSLGSYFFVERGTFRQVSLQSPSVYELLPPVDFPYSQPPPQLVMWLKKPIPEDPTAAAGAAAAEDPKPTSAAAAAAGGGRKSHHSQQCPQCQHCGSSMAVGGLPPGPPAAAAAAAEQGVQGRGEGREREQDPPLACVSHTCYTVHRPPPRSPGSLQRAGLLPTPRISAAAPGGSERGGGDSCGSGSGGGGGISGGGSRNQAHQYVFQHDHLPALLAQLLKDNAVTVAGTSVPLPFDQELWALGQATHAAWQKAKLPDSCTFYNLHGTGMDTPYDVQYGDWWYAVQDLQSAAVANASFTYVDGDATVPTESATAHGLPDAATASVKGTHRDLVAMPEVWDQVLEWIRAEPPATSIGSYRSTAHTSCAGQSRAAVAGAAVASQPRAAAEPSAPPPAMLPPQVLPSTAGASSWVQQQQEQQQVEERGAEQQQVEQQQAEHKQEQVKQQQGEGARDWTFWNPLVWRAMLS